MSEPTRMRREIAEIPGVVGRLLAEGHAETTRIAEAIRAAHPRWVSIVARGTSDHAGIYARYLLESHLRLPVSLAAPAVTTIYEAGPDWRESLVIAISQSGQSPDVVAVTEAARRGGALTIAVTNDRASPLAEAAEHLLPCDAGEELAVAATKTYVAQLAGIAALVAMLAPDSDLAGSLAGLPEALRRCHAASERWIESRDHEDDGPAVPFARSDRALISSRGYNLATALEIALKLKETSGIFADGYSTADLLHGPVALSAPDVPMLVFRPDGPMGASIDAAVVRARESGGRAWIVGGHEVKSGGGAGQIPVHGQPPALALPLDLPEALTPLAFVLPGQLLAEAVARLRGRSPDAPSGLTKVTRTL